MKNIIFSSVVIGLSIFSCCKDKGKIRPITEILELSKEMKAYFVDYKVGTKWIYQDTLDKNNYDTIELISNVNHDVNDGGGTLSKGYELYFKPKKSKDFKIKVAPGINNSCYAYVDPLVTAAGAISFEYVDKKWAHWVTYYDSVEITGNKYYKVVYSKHNNMYHYHMNISNSEGIIFFRYRNVDKQPIVVADYKLIKIIKP
jgi:hypothetical protein